GLFYHCKPFVVPSLSPVCLSHQGQKVRSVCFRPRSPAGCHALAHLDYSCIALPLLGQCPPPQYAPYRFEQRESLLAGERARRLGSHLRRLSLSSELMGQSGKGERIRQAEGMREVLSHRHRLMALLEGLIWIPEQPERAHHVGEEKHAKINTKAQDQRAVLLGIIEGDALLELRLGRGYSTEVQQGAGQCVVGLLEAHRVLRVLGQTEELFPYLPSRSALAPQGVKIRQSP